MQSNVTFDCGAFVIVDMRRQAMKAARRAETTYSIAYKVRSQGPGPTTARLLKLHRQSLLTHPRRASCRHQTCGETGWRNRCSAHT